MSLSIALILFIRAATKHSWAFRCGFLMLDAVVAFCIIVGSYAIGTVLVAALLPAPLIAGFLAGAAAAESGTPPELDRQTIESIVSAKLGIEARMVGVMLVGVFMLFTGLLVTLSNAGEIQPGLDYSSYFLACMLMTFPSVAPSICHLGVMILAILTKPLLVSVELFSYQIKIIMQSESVRSMEVLRAVLTASVFLVVLITSISFCHLLLKE